MMKPIQKAQMCDSMRRYGGNFVSRLADAMLAADPDNFRRLCNAFPEIVEKYLKSDYTETDAWVE